MSSVEKCFGYLIFTFVKNNLQFVHELEKRDAVIELGDLLALDFRVQAVDLINRWIPT